MRLEVNPCPGITLPPGAPPRLECIDEDPVRVLLLEDSATDALLIRETLKDCPGRFSVTHVERLSAAVEHVTHHEADVILCDLGLPDASGLEAAQGLRCVAPALALIVMTRNNDEEMAVEAIRQGAQDYLIKDSISHQSILRSIRFAIRRQRAQTEIDFIRSRRLLLREDFISDAFHELRSPLSAIHQSAAILADEISGSLNAEQARCAAAILKNAGRLAAMIDNLLDVARIQSGKLAIEPQVIFAQGFVADIVKSFQPAARLKGIQVVMESEAALPPAWADPRRVHQVLENLVSNALRFTSDGGTVTIRLRHDSAFPASLVLEVADTGCGIKPEDLDLDHLVHRACHDIGGRRGLGLGLFISRELVARLGGEIRAESNFGSGSTFYFTLPVYSSEESNRSIM